MKLFIRGRDYCAVILLVLLSACGGGGSVDGAGVSQLQVSPPEQERGAGRASVNTAPFIFVPQSEHAREGDDYLLQPVVSDPDAQSLSYEIINKPAWLAFDSNNGQLSGVPLRDDVGIHTGIQILVNDGENTVASPVFSIEVTSTSAMLSWVAPTVRVDNTPMPLSEIAGYRIYAGLAEDELSLWVDVANVAITRYTLSNLPPATYYYAVTAYNVYGQEGAFSDLVSKVIR